MVTRIETYSPVEETWKYLFTAIPGEGICFYQHSPDGERKFYMVSCSKYDEGTAIRRISADNLITIEKNFAFRDKEEVELITELAEGEEYVLNIRLDPSAPTTLTRFTHETVGRDLPNY